MFSWLDYQNDNKKILTNIANHGLMPVNELRRNKMFHIPSGKMTEKKGNYVSCLAVCPEHIRRDLGNFNDSLACSDGYFSSLFEIKDFNLNKLDEKTLVEVLADRAFHSCLIVIDPRKLSKRQRIYGRPFTNNKERLMGEVAKEDAYIPSKAFCCIFVPEKLFCIKSIFSHHLEIRSVGCSKKCIYFSLSNELKNHEEDENYISGFLKVNMPDYAPALREYCKNKFVEISRQNLNGYNEFIHPYFLIHIVRLNAPTYNSDVIKKLLSQTKILKEIQCKLISENERRNNHKTQKNGSYIKKALLLSSFAGMILTLFTYKRGLYLSVWLKGNKSIINKIGIISRIFYLLRK